MSDYKVLYIFDETDWHSRAPIAKGARDDGWDVAVGLLTLEPEKPRDDDFRMIMLPRPKTGFGPLAILQTVMAIRKCVKRENADVVHTVTLKYAFLVGLACLFLKNGKKLFTLAGLGYLFRSEGTKPKIMRTLISPILKTVLRAPHTHIIFQNPDDEKLMIDSGYVRPSCAHLVRSSGVDLSKFSVTTEPNNDRPLVLMPTRLVHGKGIAIFVEAARLLKQRGVDADFQIAGGEARHNPQTITADEMRDMTKDGAAKWLGRVDDMPGLLAGSNLIVYPSYYGEGVPRVLLEAAASARAIITTDNPGCKEAIIDGETGILIPIKDIEATADAIERLLNNDTLRQKMATAGRKLMEDDFDVNIIVKRTISVYNTALVS